MSTISRMMAVWGGVAVLLLLTGVAGHTQKLAVAPDRIPETVLIPAGEFIMGSNRNEREAAYRLDEKAYNHAATRNGRWYENERSRHRESLPAYEITRNAITNRQYEAFVSATGHPAPEVDATTWKSYGLIHPYARTRRHAWLNGAIPAGRGDHPVVLVTRADAEAYARWLSSVTGDRWRLPTETEWEKAARGGDGRAFPWGNRFDAKKLNSADAGPSDTVPAGSFPAAASPFGMLDAAGQVFEWTATSDEPGRSIVKGGSWDDKGCGVCRPAARHGRPDAIKHILIGFRLVKEAR